MAAEFCPYCDQPVPNDKAEQVRARAEAKDRELTARLTQKFALEIASREAAAREDGRKAADAMLQERLIEQQRTSQTLIAGLQEKLGEAERGQKEAANQVEALRAAHETEVQERVQEVREALEADKITALNAESAKHFEENRKLSSTVEELKRQLEKKTANELGEGAEINLFETLKGAFEGDRIRRVNKGIAGADIIHEIVHNDKICGVIVYDSKNRNAWRSEYVTKLREDQIAAKAEHAILVTLKFPTEQRQFCIQDGVIIANAARVLFLAQMVRRHIVQVHTMRLSNNERSQKTAALYGFIRSERCQQLFERIDSKAEDLLKLQEQEKKAHEKTWKDQGALYRCIQRTCGELTSEIDRIIGTDSDAR